MRCLPRSGTRSSKGLPEGPDRPALVFELRHRLGIWGVISLRGEALESAQGAVRMVVAGGGFAGLSDVVIDFWQSRGGFDEKCDPRNPSATASDLLFHGFRVSGVDIGNHDGRSVSTASSTGRSEVSFAKIFSCTARPSQEASRCARWLFGEF